MLRRLPRRFHSGWRRRPPSLSSPRCSRCLRVFVGDLMLVRPGSTIAVDGVGEEGEPSSTSRGSPVRACRSIRSPARASLVPPATSTARSGSGPARWPRTRLWPRSSSWSPGADLEGSRSTARRPGRVMAGVRGPHRRPDARGLVADRQPASRPGPVRHHGGGGGDLPGRSPVRRRPHPLDRANRVRAGSIVLPPASRRPGPRRAAPAQPRGTSFTRHLPEEAGSSRLLISVSAAVTRYVFLPEPHDPGQ